MRKKGRKRIFFKTPFNSVMNISTDIMSKRKSKQNRVFVLHRA